jgi:hypothetical protein
MQEPSAGAGSVSVGLSGSHASGSDRGATTGGAAARESHDWDAPGRLHDKGFISNPVSKARSVGLTEEGTARSEELIRELFGGRRGETLAEKERG